MIYLVYSLISALATIFGGLLFFRRRMKRVQFRYLIGFASGLILSVAFFEMLPQIQNQFSALALGFFSLYLIEKIIMIHACGEEECDAHKQNVGWVSIIGIAAESLVDGIAIAVGFVINPAVGLGIATAVIIHEIPRGFSTVVIMKASKLSMKKIFVALGIDSFATPLGSLLVFFNAFPTNLFAPLLAFAAGTFLYIGASDLLPEAHRVFNLKVVLSVLLGALLIPAAELWI